MVSELDSCGLDRTVDCPVCPDPGEPPLLIEVLATGTLVPRHQPTVADLNAPIGSSVYVKWRVTEDLGLASRPITVAYSVDDAAWTTVATDLRDGANGCTVDEPSTMADDGSTGCYVWQNGSPTSAYFRVRITARDFGGQLATGVSPALNAPRLRILAGRADPGTGGSAERALFWSRPVTAVYGDSQSFVVDDAGRLFFRDRERSVLWVDPSDGVQRVLVPATGSSSGDGPLATATVNYVHKLTLDAAGRLLLLDTDRIRRIDLTNMTITRIIGGGALTADDVPALDLQITPYAGGDLLDTWALFTSLPNGDLWFTTESTGRTVDGFRVRVYDAATGRVRAIAPTGLGYSGSMIADISTCALQKPAIVFNPSTSAVEHIFMRVRDFGAWPGCDQGGGDGVVRLNAAGVSEAPHWGMNPTQHAFTAADGRLYTSSKRDGEVNSFDALSGVWTPIAGGGVSLCPDGTDITTCALGIDDAFVDTTGRVHFVEAGRIRYVDALGRAATLAGQSRSFGDGLPATAARIGSATDVQPWRDDDGLHVLILDHEQRQIRELRVGGTIDTVAGNGANGLPSVMDPANAQPLLLSLNNGSVFDTMAAVSTDGRVFLNRGGAVAYLDRGTGTWVDAIGGGMVDYYDVAAEGLPGSQIALANRTPTVFGYDGRRVAVGVMAFTTGFTDAMLKLYDADALSQTHLAGVLGPATSFCADTTDVALCNQPRMSTDYLDWVGHDAYASTYLVSTSAGIRLMPVGGQVNTLFVPPRSITAVAYHNDHLGKEVAFYCGDGGLFRYDLTTMLETPLTLPTSAMSCIGRRLTYMPDRGSLLTALVIGGVVVIAEVREVDTLGAVSDDRFDDGDPTTNANGIAGTVVPHGPALEQNDHMLLSPADANDAAVGISSNDVVTVMDPTGATFKWVLRGGTVTVDQTTAWGEPASGSADVSVQLAAISTAHPNTDIGTLEANAAGGVTVQLYYERMTADDDLTVTGSVRVTNSTRTPSCSLEGCPGLETVASFSLPDYTGKDLLSVSLRLSDNGYQLRCNQRMTVTSGALDGVWSALTTAPLSTEFDSGAYSATSVLNLGTGRGATRLERVWVVR